jgi:hypothetical protein
MRSWKSHRLTSHTWLGINPQIGRPLSRIVGAIGLFIPEKCLFKKTNPPYHTYDNMNLFLRETRNIENRKLFLLALKMNHTFPVLYL